MVFQGERGQRLLSLDDEAGFRERGVVALHRGIDFLQSVEEGIDSLQGLATAGPHSPARDTFAGNIRVAPSDPLPWPFSAPSLRTPSPFTPIRMRPHEWRDVDGQWVFGWRLAE